MKSPEWIKHTRERIRRALDDDYLNGKEMELLESFDKQLVSRGTLTDNQERRLIEILLKAGVWR